MHQNLKLRCDFTITNIVDIDSRKKGPRENTSQKNAPIPPENCPLRNYLWLSLSPFFPLWKFLSLSNIYFRSIFFFFYNLFIQYFSIIYCHIRLWHLLVIINRYVTSNAYLAIDKNSREPSDPLWGSHNMPALWRRQPQYRYKFSFFLWRKWLTNYLIITYLQWRKPPWNLLPRCVPEEKIPLSRELSQRNKTTFQEI